MIRVITYGTYDLLHYGHIRLLERAKALGDYLIVGITADDFDMNRGKINVQQSLMERVEAVRATGLADEIIIEEFEGQKIDDIIRHNVDIFTVGSDWKGKFDYLNEYCKVVYLDRTQGVSSTEIRSSNNPLRMAMVGEYTHLRKVCCEAQFVNGLTVSGIMYDYKPIHTEIPDWIKQYESYDELVSDVDAVYVASHPSMHYEHIMKALTAGRHVLCESPVVLNLEQYEKLKKLAEEKGCILMEGLKTAYATAYYRLLLMVKGGIIGEVISVDATCTSLRTIDYTDPQAVQRNWNSICGWGPTAMLPVFQILGCEPSNWNFFSRFGNKKQKFDTFTKIDFQFPEAVASIKVGKGIKSEGELVISGTNGYIYVPAPWWKTEYFEVRYENSSENKRFFYKLEGEGIRYELVHFVKNAEQKLSYFYIDERVTKRIIRTIEDFYH